MSIKSYQTEGIIIRRYNQGDRDKTVTVFTRERGKITAIAKGARKINSRRGGHLELFNKVKLTIYQGKGLDTITGAVSIDCFPCLRLEPNITQLAYYVCEITEGLLAEKQKHPEIFSQLIKVLGNCTVDSSREYSIFLCQTLGFLPQKNYPSSFNVHSFIENLLERRLKTLSS